MKDRVYRSEPSETFQIRTSWSYENADRVCQSAEKAKFLAAPPVPAWRVRSCLPPETGHNSTLEFAVLAARVCPSGEKAMENTLASQSRLVNRLPSEIFHNRTVLSSDPEARVCPSGEKATL